MGNGKWTIENDGFLLVANYPSSPIHCFRRGECRGAEQHQEFNRMKPAETARLRGAEWPECRLGDVVTRLTNGYVGPTRNIYQDEGVPYLLSRHVKSNRLTFDGQTHVAQAFNQKNKKSILKAGDVLLVQSGHVGHSAVVPPEHEGHNCHAMIVISPVTNRMSGQFLSLFFESPSMQAQFERMHTGSTLKHLNCGDVKELQIPLPPLSEQQRIVGILSKAFEGIATAKDNAEKNLQNARALFESHLQAVFSQRGEGWTQKTIEEVATIFGRGKSKHRPRNAPHLYGGKHPFVQTGDVRNADHMIIEYSQTYSEAGLAQSKLWPKGTICITIAANIAETGILGFDACFPDSVIGVVANPKEADVGFIEYLLQSFKARLQAMGKGSAQANINLGTFENERFPFPSVAEQKQIVAKLDNLREETQRLGSMYQRKLTTLEALKKSLLHKAFAGEL
jgi:type I restriction enzyme S subunit